MAIQVGSRVVFKPGREGTFERSTLLTVDAIVGEWAIVRIGRVEWPIAIDRLDEAVDG